MHIFQKVFYAVFSIFATIAYLVPQEYLQNILPIIYFSLAASGFIRVTIYHPYYNHTYYAWLMNSPWKGETLPAGSVNLKYLDGTVLFLVLAVSYVVLPATEYLHPLIIFLCFYNLALLATFNKNAAYLPVLAFPYFYLSDFHPLFLIVTMTIITAYYQYLYLRDRRSLFTKYRKSKILVERTYTNPVLPTSIPENSSLLDKSLMVATLVSYSIAIAVYLNAPEILSTAYLIAAATAIFVFWKGVLVLQFGYCSGFIFRIKHFILWDYKFDRALITPLMLLITGCLLSYLSTILEIKSIIAFPLAVLILSLIGFFTGPSHKEWVLTGKIELYKPRNIQLKR